MIGDGVKSWVDGLVVEVLSPQQTTRQSVLWLVSVASRLKRSQHLRDDRDLVPDAARIHRGDSMLVVVAVFTIKNARVEYRRVAKRSIMLFGMRATEIFMVKNRQNFECSVSLYGGVRYCNVFVSVHKSTLVRIVML